MDDIRFRHFSPIVTGTPGAGQGLYPPSTSTQKNEPSVSFADVLRSTIEKNSEVNFSNHAIKRAVDHNMDITDDELNRLNEGVRLASEKNLDDTLILVGEKAFVVSVKNNTVITTVNNNSIQGNVFTNINGAVIV
jgi:flagellar operon protein